MDFWTFIKDYGLYGTIGGIIGSLITTLLKNIKQKESLAKSLIAELEGIKEHWIASSGGGLQPLQLGQTPPLVYSHVAEDYFTVFNNNSDKIGLLKEDDAKKVIKVYIFAKGFVDSLRTWEEEVRHHVNARHSSRNDFDFLDYYNLLYNSQTRLFLEIDEITEDLNKYKSCF